jgi:chemotaxis protein methyltransferase CheR
MTMAWSHPAYATVAHIVGAQTGLSFESTRRADAEAGIRRAMARSAVADMSRYAELLVAGDAPFDDLVTELTVGETYFFREPLQFEFIRREIFPEVLQRLGFEHELRLWSAGCATGEEAYSLAFLLEEWGLDGHVLATDISRDALQRARQRLYRRWSLRGLDDLFVQRFFRPIGNRWQLDGRLERHVTFAFHNLAQGANPPGGSSDMDLILCRNVLIYFDRASIARVARSLYEWLSDDGWLVTGASDPPLEGLAPFTRRVTDAGVFYRKGERPLSVAVGDVRYGESIGEATEEAHPPTDTGTPPLEPLPAGTSAHRPLDEAREALAAGEYERAAALTRDAHDEAGVVLHLRALANARGSAVAVLRAERAARQHPLSAECHLVHAVLLLDLKRYRDTELSLKRALYLDRSLAIANYLLGSTLRDQSRSEEAWRAYRNARDLAGARPPDEELPLADGTRAAALVSMAGTEMARLDARQHGHGRAS